LPLPYPLTCGTQGLGHLQSRSGGARLLPCLARRRYPWPAARAKVSPLVRVASPPDLDLVGHASPPPRLHQLAQAVAPLPHLPSPRVSGVGGGSEDEAAVDGAGVGSTRVALGAGGGAVAERTGRCGRADGGTVAERRMGWRRGCGEEDGAVHGRAVAELALISLLLPARAAG
jgi:hypothetical protein